MCQYQLGCQHRIQKNPEIKHTYHNGFRLFSDCWEVFVLNHLQGECSRLAVIVGKKVSKRAVDRNRIRRIAREFWRQCDKRFKTIADYVIVAKPCAKDTSNENLINELKTLL